jgi:hypothetical protein
VRHFVGLSARGLEQDRGSDAPVDVAQWSLGIGVERLAVRLLARDVRVDRRDQPRLAELAQHHAAETRLGQRRRAKRDQRLVARFPERILRSERYPLRQHRQRAARLLVLRQRLPLALEN